MSSNINSKSKPVIEKTLNIFDESTKTAFEQFQFYNVDGGHATVELRRDEFDSPKTLLAEVRRGNGALPDDPTKRKHAAETAIKSEPKRFATRPKHVGWQIRENAAKPYAFLLGANVIQPLNAKKLVLSPSWLNDCHLLIPPKTGSLDAWQEVIAKPALQSSRLVLAISCSFAAMVMRLSDVSNFGINLYGPSKCGKSTALLAGTSVYGIGREEDLANWSATTAANYEIARAFTDLMMPINETSLIQGARKDAYTGLSNWIFSYSEGRDRSKHSASQYASKQSAARFHGIFFATSERSLDDFARIANAERVDGEFARCTDVPALPDGDETIFDRFETTSKRKATVAWARTELERFRRECRKNCGVAAHAFINRLPVGWAEHPAFIEAKVKEFVGEVNGGQLAYVKHHVAKNFGIIYAGGCLGIEQGILPWDPEDLLECIRTCFTDAMQCLATPDDVLLAGQAKLSEALQQSERWPSISKWPQGGKGFVKPEGGRIRHVAETHAFRALFDDDNQARIILNWLHTDSLLKVSQGAKVSLEAAIWHGTTPKWPDGEIRRSYEFLSPFGSETKKQA